MSQSGMLNTEGEPPQPGTVQFLQGNDGIPVGPNASGTIFTLGGTGVKTSGNAGTNTETWNVVGGGLKWNVISANQTLAVNNGYIVVSPGGAVSLALPAVSALGDVIRVTLDGATSWTITIAGGQSVQYANINATSTLTTTSIGDTVELVCQIANTRWNMISAVGNINAI